MATKNRSAVSMMMSLSLDGHHAPFLMWRICICEFSVSVSCVKCSCALT